MNSLDLKDDKGPFDIIGDVHGCYDELCELLKKLGYYIDSPCYGADIIPYYHPDKRRVIFVGDLTDRGPKSVEVLGFLMNYGMFSVVGNHDDKLKRYLQGKNIQIRDGLQKTINQLNTSIDWYPSHSRKYVRDSIIELLEGLPSHLILDEGRLAVTHGALKEEYFGLDTPEVKAYCMYGAPNGRRGDYGEPLHHPWAEEYKGDTLIVHGHIVVEDVKWVNNTVDIDTGCVFGGKLTAFRYPEREIVQVQANRNYHND